MALTANTVRKSSIVAQSKGAEHRAAVDNAALATRDFVANTAVPAAKVAAHQTVRAAQVAGVFVVGYFRSFIGK